ncbi:MAG: class I SAM-dependent RNA methyltransferase [Candidatus Dormibacteria bacterium]
MVHGGACLVRLEDGTTVLVDGAIPGERVVLELGHRSHGSWFGRAVDILDPSPQRTVPPCPYVPDCGGCDLQHVEYSHQLNLKREIVADALRRARVPLDDGLIEVHGMETPWAYRWRGEFHVIPGPQGLRDATLGFNRARSWRPVAVERCLIHHDSVNDCLPALRDAVRAGGSTGLTVLHVTVGEDGGELLVRGRPRAALAPSAVDDASLGLPAGRRLSTHSTALSWRGQSFRVVPEAFIQVSWSQMDLLYSCVLQGLGAVEGRRIIDAYAGIGVLAALLAAAGAEVVCIEENRAAATLGVRNAELNGVSERVHYRAETVESALPSVGSEPPVDAVILDPPRAGCDRRVVAWLALAGPPRMVYVSCDPATLARDLSVLTGSGPYRIERFHMVDMFPQTHHVESAVILSREA